MFLDDGKKRAGFLVTSTTTTEGETMKKILGILAVVLLVCGTAIARPQKADTTGPPSLTKVTGSEIGVTFNNSLMASVVDIDVFASINRLAIFMGSNIGVQVENTALFMNVDETTQPMPVAVLDSAISILFKQATFAFIHTEEGTEVSRLLKGPRTLAFIHQPRTVLRC